MRGAVRALPFGDRCRRGCAGLLHKRFGCCRRVHVVERPRHDCLQSKKRGLVAPRAGSPLLYDPRLGALGEVVGVVFDAGFGH